MVFIIIFLNIGAASQIFCNLEGFSALCSKIPPGSQSHIPLSNGCYLQRPDTSDKKILSTSEKTTAKNKIQKQFLWVQDQMKREILAGTSLQNLNSKQKSWYDRISSLKVIAVDCEGNGSGGRYDASLHTVQICINDGMMSEAQLVRLLAHEAGHSIDGCVSQIPLYQRVGHLNSPARGAALDSNTTLALRQLNQTNYFVPDFKSKYSRPEDLEMMMPQWEARGLIKKMDQGISNHDFPFAPILSCLQRQGLIKAGSEQVRTGDDCRNSVVSETPADIWGARIAGSYLKLNPPVNDLERLASLSETSIRLMCSKRDGPKPLAPLDSDRWNRSKQATFRYINDRYRDEATYLADTNVQQALGCAPPVNQMNCMQQFDKSMKDFSRSGSTEDPSAPIVPVERVQ